MLQSYIFIRYLCKYKAKIIPKCQMMAKVIPCFLPRLVTKKYPAVNLPDRMKHFVGEVIFFLAFWIVG